MKLLHNFTVLFIVLKLSSNSGKASTTGRPPPASFKLQLCWVIASSHDTNKVFSTQNAHTHTNQPALMDAVTTKTSTDYFLCLAALFQSDFSASHWV